MKYTFNVERTVLEDKFLDVYGDSVFERIQEFIIANDHILILPEGTKDAPRTL